MYPADDPPPPAAAYPFMPEPDTSDDAWVRAFKKGSDQALNELVKRHGGPLMAYLRCRSADADDLFQETWLRAITRINRFRSGNFRAWLIVIARNCLIDGLRRARPGVSFDSRRDERSLPLSETLPDPRPTAPDGLASDEEQQRIEQHIMALPPTQREVFLLRTQQELSFAEIARLLGIPLNTALGRMHYAVTRLRRELEPPS